MRGIVRAHGGVLQTHEMPGMSGSAYVLEVPLGAGSGTVMPPEPPVVEAPAEATAGGVAGAGAVQEQPGTPPGGRRRARRASTDAFLESPVGAAEAGPGADTGAVEPTGRRRARRGTVTQEESAQQLQQGPQSPQGLVPAQQQGEGSGRRRGRPSPAEATAAPVQSPLPAQSTQSPQPGQGPGQALALPGAAAPSEGSVVTAAEGAQGGGGRPQRGQTVPPQGVPAEMPVSAGGHRTRQGNENQLALPAVAPAAGQGQSEGGPQQGQAQPQPTGRRARRALGTAQDRSVPAESTGPRTAFALPPAEADRIPPTAGEADASLPGRHDAVRAPQDGAHTPPQAHPGPTGRRRARQADAPQQPEPLQQPMQPGLPAQPGGWAENGASGQGPASLTPPATTWTGPEGGTPPTPPATSTPPV